MKSAGPRAAIYARYSSEMQSQASITDQVRLCRRLCDERGWTVTEVFADEAISGATHLRPDFQRMQQAAMRGEFDVLVAEALDRLSRDQEHIAGLHKRMRFLGVDIVTKVEGEISEMHVGLGGTMSALFLRQLAQKTHRGLEGRVKQGKSAGGISYGYALDRQPRADGTFSTGDRVVDAAEATVVRRIFTEYDRGKSARAIAVGLNRDGIAPPRSGGEGLGHLVLFDHLGQLEARHGDPQQRALHRAAGLEPATLREGPRYREAAGAAESAGGVGDRGRARSAHHRG